MSSIRHLGATLTFIRKKTPHYYDVSFVGQYHPHRAWYFRHLKKAGIDVHAWGYGWPNGRLSFNDMIDVFNQSKINLNMSNCVSWDLRYLSSSPGQEVRMYTVGAALGLLCLWATIQGA